MLAKFFTRALGRINCNVHITHNGQSAVETFKRLTREGVNIDLIILDINVGDGLGGKETFDEIVKIDPQAKVVACSGASLDPLITNYADYGFIGAIAKPDQVNELTQKVQSFLV